MPFTPTHVLAVVPIVAILPRLPLSALAIGSMIPDLPLFLSFAPSYAVTHSLTGVVIACLPLGALVFLLFQYLLKVPMVALLPPPLQARMSSCSYPFIERSLLFWARVGAAILIGSLTHIVWDAFTHEGRWGVQMIPALNEDVVISGRSVPAYKLLQYGSTVIGLPLLFAVSLRWLSRAPLGTFEGMYPMSRSVKSVVLTLLIAVPVITAITIFLTAPGTVYFRIFEVITKSGLALAVVLLAYALVYQMKSMRR